jgi:23S rRNA pseudouridine2605 synthase
MAAPPRKKPASPRNSGAGASSTAPRSPNKGGRAERIAQLAKLFDGDSGPERIAKKMARAGLCSRRDAEVWINDGRVAVNGNTLTSPAYNVGDNDAVTVDGKPLMKEEKPRLWRYYKPRGLVVSNRDEKDRQTVFDVLPDHLPRVISIGRLDLDSEGLLLLTNSGDLARVLELPDTGWTRKYRVRVRGKVEAGKLNALAEGITIEGIHYRGILAKLDRQSASNAWLTIAIKEGKNREIRNVMSHLGYTVNRLIRIGYGPFQLSDMEEGAVEEIKTSVLRDQLGLPRDEKADQKTKGGKPSSHAPKPNHRKSGQAARGKSHANHQRKKTRRPS